MERRTFFTFQVYFTFAFVLRSPDFTLMRVTCDSLDIEIFINHVTPLSALISI